MSWFSSIELEASNSIRFLFSPEESLNSGKVTKSLQSLNPTCTVEWYSKDLLSILDSSSSVELPALFNPFAGLSKDSRKVISGVNL